MRFLMFGLIILLSSGCATPKQWSARGGSRSDGTVRLGYNYSLFEKPQIEGGQGTNLAKEKCRIWGYTDAKLFGNAMQQCTSVNGYGNCIAWYVYADFQCTTSAGAPPLVFTESVNPGGQTIGCGSDKDCKGDRICIEKKCVSQDPQISSQGAHLELK